MKKKQLLACLLALFCAGMLQAQKPEKPTASQIYHDLQKLNFLGTALYVAAHPDDENTRLISYLSNDVKARTAYLSLTRGDGGQNLIGPEIRELLGVIRTHELQQARKTDGGSQLFTRANDFGYSKHPDETLSIWNEDEVMSDVVRAIRKFKPDVIINRFNHRTPGTTHGHHTSSAILSFEAFDLVGDPTKYPESAEMYGAWQPKRLFFNTSWWFYGSRENFEKADKTNLMEIASGTYYPELGLSNGEIAALSRSMHKSQGFGNTGTRGEMDEWVEFLKGDFPEGKEDLFQGVDTSWNRVEGGAAIGAILDGVIQNYDYSDPSASVPELVKAYALIKELDDAHWREIKLEAISQLILDCSGIFLEAVTNVQSTTPNNGVSVTVEAVNRSNVAVSLGGIRSPYLSFPNYFAAVELKNNIVFNESSVEGTFTGSEYTSPYWLKQPGSLGMYTVNDPSLIGLPEISNSFPIHFDLNVAGQPMTITRNMVYKYNDPVKGEVYQPFRVQPEITASLSEKVMIFSSNEAKVVHVDVRAGRDNITGSVTLQHPKGWVVSPVDQTFSIENKGETQRLEFTVTPPKDRNEGVLKPLVSVGDRFYSKQLVEMDYEHIPFQQVLLPSEAKVVRIPIEKRGQLIGYINGAGDAIPESLAQIGYQVEEIDVAGIGMGSLQKYDAVVVGVRAYNTVADLAFKQTFINDYVQQGGTLVLQYNTRHRLVTPDFGPLPITLSRDRVTDEGSEVRILAPDHAVLNSPNKIEAVDFEGWVQERGLYFPTTWSEDLQPILSMNDPDSAPLEGSLLVGSYGQGHYVYTGLSFFRELPAGVSGAYRLFANLLSLGN